MACTGFATACYVLLISPPTVHCKHTVTETAASSKDNQELTRGTNQGHHQWLTHRQMERNRGSQRSNPSWSLRDVCRSSWPDTKWSSQFNNGLVRSSLKIREQRGLNVFKREKLRKSQKEKKYWRRAIAESQSVSVQMRKQSWFFGVLTFTKQNNIKEYSAGPI